MKKRDKERNKEKEENTALEVGLFSCIVNFISPPATTSIFSILDLALYPNTLFLLTRLLPMDNN